MRQKLAIFRLSQTEIYTHLNRYFPSETDGNKWPQIAIFRLAQMVPPIECDLGYRFPTTQPEP